MRARDAGANAGEIILVIHEQPCVGVGQARVDGLADIDVRGEIVGEIVAGRGAGQALDELTPSGSMLRGSLLRASC